MKSFIFKGNILKAKYEALSQYGRCVTRRLIKLPESNHEWGAPWFDKVSGKWVFVSGFGLATKSVRIKSPYQVGETVYWREPFSIAPEYKPVPDPSKCPTIYYELNNDRPLWAGYKWLSPYSMSEKLARTFVKITSVRPERLLLPLSDEELKLEGGEVVLPLLNEYDNLWLWRIEQEKM